MSVPSAVKALASELPDSKPAFRAGFPRSARVLARKEFDAVFERGRRAATPQMTLHYLAEGTSPRLGLAVSRKVDTRAVARNRIKRRLREYFRQQRHALAPGAYVIVARGRAVDASATELNEAFGSALRRVGALLARSPDGTMPAVSKTSVSAKSASVKSASATSDPASVPAAPPLRDATNSSAP